MTVTTSINLLSNNEQRNEFTHEMDAAIDMYTSAKSVPFFRNLLNERQYQQSADEAGAMKKEAALEEARKAERVRYLRETYHDRILARVGPERYEATMKLLIGAGKQNPTCPVCFRDLTIEGCPTHDIAKHDAVDADPGGVRPVRHNTVHVQWLADWNRRLVVCSQTITKTVHVSTGIWESEPKPVTYDRYFVVMVEEATLRFESERELNVANMVYFGRGVGLGKWMIQTPWRGEGRDPRKPKTWTVFEPVEEFQGPFTNADDARQYCDRWRQQLNDEFYDHFDSWLDDVVSNSWREPARLSEDADLKTIVVGHDHAAKLLERDHVTMRQRQELEHLLATGHWSDEADE
jgi:hypothetical protein